MRSSWATSVSATISAQGAVTRRLDLDQLRSRIAGMSADDAARALSDVESARVDFWPSWVNAVPRLTFRIDIAIDTPTDTPFPAVRCQPLVSRLVAFDHGTRRIGVAVADTEIGQAFSRPAIQAARSGDIGPVVDLARASEPSA